MSASEWNRSMADMRNLLDILSDYNRDLKDALYVGDDVFDIEVLQAVNEGFCPRDSPQCVV